MRKISILIFQTSFDSDSRQNVICRLKMKVIILVACVLVVAAEKEINSNIELRKNFCVICDFCVRVFRFKVDPEMSLNRS